ncbi:MAG: site-specific DNA-methyltransferase [Pyrinomonadaceae bacterium]|nr:site-specific DNA-methyltransferase [Pyrinomonadaceae bacterium]
MTKVNLYNQDCITGMAEKLQPESVDLTVTSIPFEELFVYSGKLEDVGNNGSTVDIEEGRFALNMRFVIEQLLRVTKPGANVCIHIQQLLAWKNQHGFIGRRDFRGATIKIFSKSGFHFTGEFAISKNPQAMAQRLNLHSLMFVTGKRNAQMLAPAPNDYVLIFQKPGEAKTPVRALYDPKLNPDGWVTSDEWIKWASGIWTDINEVDVLDGYRAARESDEEKHVCPLQLEVIRRLIRLYTNPVSIQSDVLILDPFGGIGSTLYVAIEQDRNAVQFELKESYHDQAVRNSDIALKLQNQTGLFEMAA